MKEENDTDEVEFNWDEYLKQTNSEAAPKSCFRQHEIPPKNEFEVGQKLETVDPRNRTSMCIATVVDKLGPRLRLRLDGTDDRNDFWLLVDSEFIHPFEYTTKRGGSIQPPLGFRNNLSTWPKFFDKLVQSAGEDTFAGDNCFKTPPVRQQKNEFKKGQKLEAVDQKNPHLICPATIKEIDKDNIYLSFDGWSHQCNFWCTYTSRDIFPVGWCKLAEHPLQLPGSYDEKRKSHRRSGGGGSGGTNLANTTNTSTTKSQAAPALNTTTTALIQKNKNNENNTSNIENSVLNTSKNDDIVTTNEKSPLKQNNINNLNNKNQQMNNMIDLSLVKAESIEAFDNFTINKNKEKEKEIMNSNNEQTNKNRDNENVNIQKEKVIVYVNSTIDCNKYLNSKKFHANYKQFGPDIPKNLFKFILQAFINCAYDSSKIFDLIQDGDSTSYIKFKTPNRNERKHLPKIENESQLWTNLQLMCKVFLINDNLFLKTPFYDTITNGTSKSHNNNNNNQHINDIKIPNINNLNLNNNSRSNSIDSNSMNSIKQSLHENSSVNNENIDENNIGFSNNNNSNNDNNNNNENLNSNKMKRRSSSDELYIQPKVLKFDVDHPNQWNIEQVSNYVMQNDPNLASHIDILRYQEIDGKALLLLTTDVMMKYMGLKLGPALKLSNLIERLKRR